KLDVAEVSIPWLNTGAWCGRFLFPRKGLQIDSTFELNAETIRALLAEVTPNPSDVFGSRSQMNFNALLTSVDTDDDRTKVECRVSPIEETELGSFIIFTISGKISTSYGLQGGDSRAEATI